MKYVGIDWATDIHFVALLDEVGEVVDEWQVPHDKEGIDGLLARLHDEGGPGEVNVAVESGVPLLTNLLLEAGYRVFEINPKQSDRFRDRYSIAGAKDDRRDALVLADAIRTDGRRLRFVERDSELTEELRMRDRARSRLVDKRTRYANQLRQVLGRYFPALLELGRSLHDPFLLALLRAYPDPVAAHRARAPRLQRLLKENRVRTHDVVSLQAILRKPAVVVGEHIVAACRDEALDLADQIELIHRQASAAEARLKELFEKHPDREILKSLPGLGDLLAIRVAAELGDTRARCGDPTIVQSFAGTAPVTKRSGKRSQTVCMRRGCNRILQACLFHMARCSVRRSRWAATYLDHVRDRGVPYAKAVRALSNKWAKIIAKILASRALYDEERHIGHLVRNRVPWIIDGLGPISRKLPHEA